MLAIKEVSRCHSRSESEESIACRQKGSQVRDPSWLWNPRQMSPEVQNKGISGPKKRTYDIHIFKRKSPICVAKKTLFILKLFRIRLHLTQKELSKRGQSAKLAVLFWIQNRETSQIRFQNPSFVHFVTQVNKLINNQAFKVSRY